MPNVSLNDAPFCVLFTDCQLHTSSFCFFPFPPLLHHLLACTYCNLIAVACSLCVAHTPRVTGISPCDLPLFVCKLAGKGWTGGNRVGGGVAWKTFAVTDRELRERGSGSVRVLSLHLHLPASSLVCLIVVAAVVVVVLVVAAVTCCHLLLARCCCCRCCCCRCSCSIIYLTFLTLGLVELLVRRVFSLLRCLHAPSQISSSN